MSNFLFVLLLLAMFATLGVLFFGLISMARGGEFNKRNANKLMRLRVLMQFVAVVLFVLLIFTLRH
jgi:Hypoxia induced protein conserved region